jgi:ABC-type phosphate transport system substrate-binding protein
MIVVASNIANLTVVNDTAATDLNSTTAPTIRFSDLRALYNGTSTIAAIVQRADMSGTEETFAKWIGVTDANNQLSTTTTQAPAYQGNQGVRDAIAAASVKTIGFVDIGFTGTLVNGNAKVLAASMNGTVAEAASKGVGGNYDKQSISIRTQVAKDSVSGQKDNGLARDLFYYNQGIPTGAVKTYLDWIMTPDGQKVVQGEGFFSN